MSLKKAMVSSKSNEWATSQKLYAYLDEIYHFTLDPCSTNENAKTVKHFTQEQDGLIQDWSKDIVFMNPPYGGTTKKWLEKAYTESCKGAVVVCLIVSSTDRSYWHEVIQKASLIQFFRGRLKFGTSKYTAPFASALIVFKGITIGTPLIQWIDLREVYQK